MNVVIGERCSGKTTRLIKKSAETGAVIVTSTSAMGDYIKDTARRMNLEIPSPISVKQWFNIKACEKRDYGQNIKLADAKLKYMREKGILIDEAQIVLQNIFAGCLIDEITLTDLGDNIERLGTEAKED